MLYAVLANQRDISMLRVHYIHASFLYSLLHFKLFVLKVKTKMLPITFVRVQRITSSFPTTLIFTILKHTL